MPESMIERVAKAICAEENEGYSWPDSPHGDPIWEDHRDLYLKCARAAIEAMRVMSDPMMFIMEDSLADDDDLTIAWDKAIDAALNEQVAG